MKLSTPGAGFLRRLEGFEAAWYLDAGGVPTIGIGFTWASAAFREWWAKNRPGQAFQRGATMTREEADDCLIYLCEREYGAAVGAFLAQPVPQHVFDGMTIPVFNLGPGALKWKWADAAKRKDLALAASLLRTTGTTAGGVTLNGLIRRRREEAELLEHGDYTIGTTAVSNLASDATALLVRGTRGAAVADLQRALTATGHYSGAVDGIFGFGTEAAVLAFQRANGLGVDGMAGPKTWTALLDKTKGAPPVPSPAPSPSPAPRPAAPQPAAPQRAPAWLVLAAAAVVAAGIAFAVITGAVNVG